MRCWLGSYPSAPGGLDLFSELSNFKNFCCRTDFVSEFLLEICCQEGISLWHCEASGLACEFDSLQLAAVSDQSTNPVSSIHCSWPQFQTISDHFRPVSQPCEFQPGEFYSLQLAAVSDQSTNSGRPSSFILPSSHGWGHAGEKEAQAAGAATGLLKVFGKILICYDRFVTCCFREPGANIMES